MTVTREEVICAYRLLLNREPENEAAIHGHLDAEDIRQLRQNFVQSPEYRHITGYLDRWMVAPVFGDTRLLWVNMRDKYVSVHCAADCYEPENSAIISTLLQPGDVFVDLGANIGWFTILASTIVGSAGRIYSFEPQPAIAQRLARTIQLNDLEEMVTLRQAGIWSEPGSMPLAGNEDSENHGAAHLTPDRQDSAQSSMVDLVTLDSLRLTRCDLIKMDIEGAEPKAMEGAAQLLRTARPVILSELNGSQLRAVSGSSPAEFIAAMASRDYICMGSRDDQAGRIISAFDAPGDIFTDVIFAPREKLEHVSNQLFARAA